MEQNKTGRYLKYAIGEITLVVIGILIALQINNWNNQRIAEKQMDSFLLGIIEDLKSDITFFDLRIEFFNSVAEQRRKILSLVNFENIEADSLFNMITPRTGNYEINVSTFDKIKSTGITQISKNDSLSENIYNYYTHGVTSLKSFMDWHLEESREAAKHYYFDNNRFEINIVSRGIDDAVELVNFQDESIRKANLAKLLTEPTFRNHLKRDYFRTQRIVTILERFKNRATDLIANIEKDLNKKKRLTKLQRSP